MIEWMDRYRELLAAMIRHSNTIAEVSSKRKVFCEGVELNNHEIEVLEYLIDNEDRHTNMTELVENLSIPQSSFSRITTTLEEAGLVEKYHRDGNMKNRLIKPTLLGKSAYKEYMDQRNKSGYSEFFEILNDLDDRSLNTFTAAINCLTDHISREELGRK